MKRTSSGDTTTTEDLNSVRSRELTVLGGGHLEKTDGSIKKNQYREERLSEHHCVLPSEVLGLVLVGLIEKVSSVAFRRRAVNLPCCSSGR